MNLTSIARFRSVLFTITAIVSLAGLANATYLAVQALTGETLACGGSPDCFHVLGSSYARVGGIPIALFGTLAYFSVFTFATFAAFGHSRARTLLTLTVGVMFGVTLWLLYVQTFLLHAFCRYCLFSAALVFVLGALVFLAPRSSRSERGQSRNNNRSRSHDAGVNEEKTNDSAPGHRG